ncbi:MAG: membrane protein insertion efficiency factor YidD [Holosporaceae bacterium]|nr:membrane protein insertion efficiency factor YidD [Holosporaceae bacterium]
MRSLVIFIIRFYQQALSPYLRHGFKCKFHPSCSQYALLAIEKFGLWIGIAKAMKRILRCHPFSHGGVDFP